MVVATRVIGGLAQHHARPAESEPRIHAAPLGRPRRFDRTPDTATFRSDYRDYTLAFTQDPVQAVGLEVHYVSDLDAAQKALGDLGLKTGRGSASDCASRKAKDMVWFTDFSGNRFELVVRPLNSGWRYFPSRDAGIRGLADVIVRSTNVEKDLSIWAAVFSNAKVRDWAGEAAYVGFDGAHHRLVPRQRPGERSLRQRAAQTRDRRRHLRPGSSRKRAHPPAARPASKSSSRPSSTVSSNGMSRMRSTPRGKPSWGHPGPPRDPVAEHRGLPLRGSPAGVAGGSPFRGRRRILGKSPIADVARSGLYRRSVARPDDGARRQRMTRRGDSTMRPRSLAFVPVLLALLARLGAEVVKVERPEIAAESIAAEAKPRRGPDVHSASHQRRAGEDVGQDLPYRVEAQIQDAAHQPFEREEHFARLHRAAVEGDAGDVEACDLMRDRWRIDSIEKVTELHNPRSPTDPAINRVVRHCEERATKQSPDFRVIIREFSMPTYEYACPACGQFTAVRPMSQYRDDQPCPRCAKPAPRVTLTSPSLGMFTMRGPGDVLGSGTVGTGCILELTPEAVGGWLNPGDVVELTIERLGTLRNTVTERPT